MNWASRPTSGCGYWSSRTWTATANGGWARRQAGGATCPPTTSANPNTHERGFIPRLRLDLKKSHCASRETNKHPWLIFDLWSWSLIVRRTDYCCWLKLAIYAYIYSLFILFLLSGYCTQLPLVSGGKPVNYFQIIFHIVWCCRQWIVCFTEQY